MSYTSTGSAAVLVLSGWFPDGAPEVARLWVILASTKTLVQGPVLAGLLVACLLHWVSWTKRG
eukprot:4336794-Prorocentrum_lima.AAC.1